MGSLLQLCWGKETSLRIDRANFTLASHGCQRIIRGLSLSSIVTDTGVVLFFLRLPRAFFWGTPTVMNNMMTISRRLYTWPFLAFLPPLLAAPAPPPSKPTP